ncbi:MAG TPA: M20/M25/M40 family metallo-hydrolase [Candidatus Saccharimonadales bacterium]|nr:M20/M25/M40 family metallo-hydrolase [Candidatus Saccharimonadales bacterium]
MNKAIQDFASKIADKWKLKTQDTSVETANKKVDDFLRDLISIPSVTGDHDANHDAFDYAERILKRRGMSIKRYEWNDIESLVASSRETKQPTVCFFGHVDVVPGPSEVFQMREKDGRLYGRGALDMKGGVAAILGAVQELPGDVADYDFAVMLTSDEETGGFDGGARLAEEMGYRPKMMIVPDGGENWNMERFAKGIWHVTIETSGKSAHGSRPWAGINAIDALMADLAAIRSLFPAKITPDTSTINIGLIQGGEAINQIPSSASASIDMRFATPQDQVRITRAVEELAEKCGFTVTTEVEADAVNNDPNNPYLKAYAECTEEIIGRPVEWITSMASNDSRFFAKYDIPCAIQYPAGANHHSTDEYIEKKALYQMQQLFINYLGRVAKSSAAAKK